MSRFSLPLTRLVHENLSIVMCFAYSRLPLSDLVDENFSGGWDSINKALFAISAARAEKALLELALFLRMVDDDARISDYFKSVDGLPNCGKLIMKDGSEKALTFRDVANKVLHSSGLEWAFPQSKPLLLCHTRDEEKWLRAEVDIVALAAFCGMLMS